MKLVRSQLIPVAEIFREDQNPDGPPMDFYAGWAKRMAEFQIQAYKIQYGLDHYSVVRPCNVYGPGDNFDPRSSHVIPALIKKCVDAIDRGDDKIVAWGTGSASREFLYVADAAQAIVFATERYNKPEPVNIGSAMEISIRELLELIAELTDFRGEIVWDNSKPDGQPRRMLDISRAE